MTHFKVIGTIWLAFCLVAAVAYAPPLWSLATDHKFGIVTSVFPASFWIIELSIETFLLFGIFVGFGLLRARRWAAISCRIAALLTLLYFLSLFFLEDSELGPAMYAAIFSGIALTGYSLLVVWRLKPYEHAA